jgi:hypothetical protein
MDADRVFGPLDPAETVQPDAGDLFGEEKKFQPMTPLAGLEKGNIHHSELGKPSHIWPYHNAAGLLDGYVCRFETIRPDGTPSKEFRPFRYGALVNGQTKVGWHWKDWGSERPLYGLNELRARPNAPVIVVEGEKKADAAKRLFPEYVIVSPMNGARSPHKSDWMPVAGRRVVIWPDHDEPGRKFAEAATKEVAEAGAASVAVVSIPVDWPVSWDLADAPPDGVHGGTLAKMLKSAKLGPTLSRASGRAKPPREPASEEKVKNEICRLVTLPRLKYELEREDVAQKLGIRVSVLDRLVKIERGDADVARGGDEAAGGPGRSLAFPEIELWPEPVDGEQLLDDIVAEMRRYIVLGTAAAHAVALWVAAVHAFERFFIFPRLFITAPEMGCGKTTLLDVIERLVPRPLTASNITAAALFRTIEAARPTLLLDEADTYLRHNEDLRAVVDAGHQRNGAVIRTVGDEHEPRRFSVWAALIIAAIRNLPGTIEDRSIRIPMRRRRADEQVASFRPDRTEELDKLARRMARWAGDNGDTLAEAEPAMPATIYNRAADNWRPLLAMAELAGADWPDRARQAAIELSSAADDAVSSGVLLLSDIRKLFYRDPLLEVLFTHEILHALQQDENRPWPEWKNGKPITNRQLAALLKPYGIRPRTVRRGAITDKGYKLDWFEDAFARYLPSRSVTMSQSSDSAGFEPPQSVTQAVGAKQNVTDTNLENASISADCDGVTAPDPVLPDEEAVWTG